MNFADFIYLVVGPINGTLMIILNSLEIFFLLKHDVSKVKSFVYFVNLAASHLFLGSLIIVVRIMTLFEPKNTYSILKTVRLFLQMKAVGITLYCSVLTFAVLTFERMLAVKKPIYYRQILYKTKCFVSVMIWIIAAAIVLFLHFVVKDAELEHVFTPWIIIGTSMLGVISYIITRNALKGRMPTVGNTTHQDVEKTFTVFCIRSIILFMICWLPLAVFGFLFSSGLLVNWKYMMEFRFTTYVIAFGNSIGTPILFLSQNQRWKIIFRKNEVNYLSTHTETTSTV